MGHYVRSNRLGRVVTEMMFTLDRSSKLKRRPDGAFVSVERWALDRPLDRKFGWEVVPDLVIEVTSPSDRIDKVMDKIDEYFEAGVQRIWMIYPKHRRVYVHESPELIRVLRVGDVLDGGALIPGFRVAVLTIFETEAGDITPVG